MDFKAFDTREDLYDAACNAAVEGLKAGLEDEGSASLLLSGGSTPAPVYEQLSGIALPWPNIFVGLVDERWVDDDNAASNARLVRDSLLRHTAADARFIPMKTEHENPASAVSEINAAYAVFRKPDVVILGMGPDGHTASWFPGADGLETAMSEDTDLLVTAINAANAPVAGDHPERMTITLPVIASARRVLLLITGRQKRDVYESNDGTLPIHILLNTLPEKVETLWSL